MALTTISKDVENIADETQGIKDENKGFFEVNIDESNIFSESIDDVIGRFERIARLADEGKLNPPGGVANYYSFPKKKE